MVIWVSSCNPRDQRLKNTSDDLLVNGISYPDPMFGWSTLARALVLCLPGVKLVQTHVRDFGIKN